MVLWALTKRLILQAPGRQAWVSQFVLSTEVQRGLVISQKSPSQEVAVSGSVPVFLTPNPTLASVSARWPCCSPKQGLYKLKANQCSLF